MHRFVKQAVVDQLEEAHFSSRRPELFGDFLPAILEIAQVDHRDFLGGFHPETAESGLQLEFFEAVFLIG